MISDADLNMLKKSKSRRQAEIRKVEATVNSCITWLKLYAREGDTEGFDKVEEDLTQALVELWQLCAVGGDR